jgi:hypothetical protein
LAKRIDITGQQFSNWKVNYRLNNSRYMCTCLLCGKQYEVESYKLRKGLTKSCFNCAMSTRSSQQVDNKYSKLYKLFKNENVIYNTEIFAYLPDKKIGINFVPNVDNENITMYNVQKLTLQYREKDIRLINIFSYEWEDEDKQDKLVNTIKIALGASEIRRIYARKTKIVLMNSRDTREFLDENHLQGYTSAPINIGLTYNDELVALMTFGRPRFSGESEYELIRLAFKANTIILGGEEKLFRYFIQTYKPDSVLSYCNLTKFRGDSYYKVGFKTYGDCITSPNYMWVNEELKLALPRYKCMKHKLLQRGWGTADMTENEIMRSIGFKKVYDAGNIKFLWYAESN